MRSIRALQNFSMLLILLCLAPAAWGQTNVEVNAGIQFNFSTPGARSLAMGSAFLGLADDATAAYANPAGLTTLTKPEVSFEGRRWGYSNVFTDRGRLSGDPTGNGVDTIAGLRNGESTNSVSGLSFLSAVFPWSRWRIAFYRHELANFEAGFKTQGAILLSGSSESSNFIVRLRPTQNTLNLDITNLGVSIAARINDSWSLGAGVSSYSFHQASLTERFNLDIDDPFGPPLYSPANLADLQTQRGDDRGLGFNAGFLWRIRDGLALGGAYRQGPKFDLTATRRSLHNAEEASKPARFDSPDFLGVGLSWGPTRTTILNLDVNRIMYSQLTSHFSGIVKGEGNLDLTPEELRRFRVENATEIHLGFEKSRNLFNRMVFARLGAWSDPDHRILYEGDDPNFQALFRRGRDEIHYSAGLGVSSERVELNCAIDLSNRVDTLSISTVFRF